VGEEKTEKKNSLALRSTKKTPKKTENKNAGNSKKKAEKHELLRETESFSAGNAVSETDITELRKEDASKGQKRRSKSNLGLPVGPRNVIYSKKKKQRGRMYPSKKVGAGRRKEKTNMSYGVKRIEIMQKGLNRTLHPTSLTKARFEFQGKSTEARRKGDEIKVKAVE